MLKIHLEKGARGSGGGGACHVIVVLLGVGRERGDVILVGRAVRGRRMLLGPGTRKQRGDGRLNTSEELCKGCIVLLSLPL